MYYWVINTYFYYVNISTICSYGFGQVVFSISCIWKGEKKATIGRSAYPSFLRCKVIVGHSFKENIYKFNICNYLLWKDILKPNVMADKGSGWTVV